MLDFCGKTLEDLYNMWILKNKDAIDTLNERDSVDKEIEKRLRKSCSLYNDICNEIDSMKDPRRQCTYNLSKSFVYDDIKIKLRKWLLENPKFLDEVK